jgi:ligand-binding sensor domain-containing protein/signal transduction histidine kinase/DNA-binding response OmpR family regulator
VRTFLTLLLIFCLAYSDHAQPNRQFSFDHLTIEDGLSQSTVFAITKDADGYMWFGTRDGLNRYDSRAIKVYRNKENDPNSLSGNSINCFLIDQKKNLWIGTNEGISIFNPVLDNFERSLIDPVVDQKLADNHVLALAQEDNGTIWVGTFGGLNKVTNTNPIQYEHFKHAENDPASLLNNEVRALFIDKEKTLWVATGTGISKMIRNKGKTSFINFPLPSHYLQSKSWINCLAENEDGDILIGTEQNGLNVLKRYSGTITPVILTNHNERSIQSVRVIEKFGSKYWIGTIDGLFIYDSRSGQTISFHNNPDDNSTLSDNSIRAIFSDPAGSYWLGTFYGGVNIYSPLARQFGEVRLTNKRNQTAYKIAGAIITDKNQNLWISTDGNGLYCLNKKGEIIKQFKHVPGDESSLSHNKIKCLLLDDDGLWIGTIIGLNFYDFKTDRIVHFNPDPQNPLALSDDRIYDLEKDSDGNIWVGTYRGGLCRYNKKTKTFDRFVHDDKNPNTISSNGITFIREDSDKNVWVGTISGLNKKSYGSSVFEQYGNYNQNIDGAGDYILCIYEDGRKNLWLGTRETGLQLLKNNEKQFSNYTIKDGLPGNTINGIQEDAHGNLWISTDNGLSKFNPSKGTFKNYNQNDGLVCKEFNFNSFHKDPGGTMYFGGYNGIVKFHPDSIRENHQAPTLQFTRLKLFNEEVRIDSDKKSVLKKSLSKSPALEFNYQQNIFSIEFAALSFINSDKNQYAYKLENFEDQWNYVDDPVATYMNLEPGSYSLLVKASNNDGVWVEEPIALKINVLPPPWKSWWAYTIYVLIILGLLFALIRFNKMRWKLAHDLKIEHIEKEQQENLHRAKLSFFTNIAHEIRTPLTLIVSPVEVVVDKYPGDAFIQKQLSMVKTNTGRLMRLINQLLDFQKQETGSVKLKLAEGNLVELLKEIVFSFSEFANTRHVGLSFKSEVENVPVNFDRDEMEKVFCNLLHNSFKFTPGGGEIKISVSQEETPGQGFAKIVLEDNGIGIPAEDLPKIFNRFFQVENGVNESGFGIGLALTKGIIDLHNGTITVESKEAEIGQHGFTRFILCLPLTSSTATSPIETFINNHTLPINDIEAIESAKKEIPTNDQHLILLVEDNIEIRNCLKTILGSKYQILEAGDGEEACELALNNLPDLIISDIAMPKKDGIEFVRQLKSDERTSHIPIILLTARGAMDHHIEGISTGVDDYITKPFHTQILQLKIENLLASRERLKEKYHRVVTIEPHHEEVEDPDNKFLNKLLTLLEEHLSKPDFNVSRLVAEIGMSRPVLFRKVKMLTGLSVIDLIRSTRLKRAEMLLKQKKMSISEVAFTVGFNDPKYFSKSFRAQFGKTPSEYLDSLN